MTQMFEVRVGAGKIRTHTLSMAEWVAASQLWERDDRPGRWEDETGHERARLIEVRP